MKKAISITIILALTAVVFNRAEAQRGGGRDHQDGERHSSNGSPQRNFGSGNPGRSAVTHNEGMRQRNINNVTRSATFRQNNGQANVVNDRIISPNQQRNRVAAVENRSRYNGYATSPRVYRQTRVVDNQRNVNRTVYRTANYSNRGGYSYNRGRYYPRFFSYGPRYSVLPRSFITINFGGYPYHYYNGLFYGSYGGYYQSLFPPPGIGIAVLPFGYSRIFIGNDLFYYYNGIYYRQYPDQSNYEVVDAPMGATVSSLPRGAKSVVLNGEKLYELNGTYYKEDRNSKGATVYTVVGKNGEINNSDAAPDNAGLDVPPASLDNGEILSQLPEGSKTVTINGEKLFVTPDNTYLKEENEGDEVQYKVVGR